MRTQLPTDAFRAVFTELREHTRIRVVYARGTAGISYLPGYEEGVDAQYAGSYVDHFKNFEMTLEQTEALVALITLLRNSIHAEKEEQGGAIFWHL